MRGRLQSVEKEAKDRELTQMCAMDFTEDAAVESGIDCTESTRELIDTLEQCGRAISKVHSALARHVSGYMTPNPYGLYTEQELLPPEEGEKYGTYIVTFQSNCYAEIAPMLETAAQRLREQKEVRADEELGGMVDFMAEDEEVEAEAPRQQSAA